MSNYIYYKKKSIISYKTTLRHACLSHSNYYIIQLFMLYPNKLFVVILHFETPDNQQSIKIDSILLFITILKLCPLISMRQVVFT